jgi:NitT/TauT family transport system permease protein
MELPFATTGLVWNSMMSMAGGWFFLMINEAFVLGDKDFRLPGVGSYMSVAAAQGNIPAMIWAILAMIWAILAMIAMIIFLDQFLWRPVVVWAQKFRVEESGAQEAMNSWFLDFLRRSHLLERLKQWIDRRRKALSRPVPDSALTAADPPPITSNNPKTAAALQRISIAFFLLLMGILLYGAWRLMEILREVQITHWLTVGTSAFLTLFRVLAATAIGTLWAVPAGLAIGLSPRLSRLLQPVVQVAASFPAPMLFPMVIWVLVTFGIGLGTGSIVLMLLGTQWYILFNVIAGAMAVPSDLREATKSFRMGRWQRFRKLYLPATFPYLVTG